MQEQRVGRRQNIAERLRRAGLHPQEHTVRKAILTAFAAGGKAPSVEELADTLGLPLAAVLEVCRTLAADDLIRENAPIGPTRGTLALATWRTRGGVRTDFSQL